MPDKMYECELREYRVANVERAAPLSPGKDGHATVRLVLAWTCGHANVQAI